MTSWLYINTRAKRQPRGKTVPTAAPDLQTAATGAGAGRSGRQASLLASRIHCLVKLVASPSERRPSFSNLSQVVTDVHGDPPPSSRGTIDWVTYYP